MERKWVESWNQTRINMPITTWNTPLLTLTSLWSNRFIKYKKSYCGGPSRRKQIWRSLRREQWRPWFLTEKYEWVRVRSQKQIEQPLNNTAIFCQGYFCGTILSDISLNLHLSRRMLVSPVLDLMLKIYLWEGAWGIRRNYTLLLKQKLGNKISSAQSL